MTSPSTGTTGQTEWAVMCHNNTKIYPQPDEGTAREKAARWDRTDGCTERHRLISRTVGPWTEDE